MNTIPSHWLCPECGSQIDIQGYCRCYGGTMPGWARNVITGQWDRLAGGTDEKS